MVGCYLGAVPNLIIADLDMIREIVVKKSWNYLNRPKLPIQAEPVVDTVVGLRGLRWKQVRKTISPAFSSAKVKIVTDLIRRKIHIVETLIDKGIDENKNVDMLSLYQGIETMPRRKLQKNLSEK